MAVIELDNLIKVKDEKGNIYLLYPITRADLIVGLDDLLDGKAPKIHAHDAATSAADGFMSAADKAYLSSMDTKLALKADKKTLLELDTTTQHSSMSDYTSSGMYWINPGVTTDVPGGQWGFLRVFACGNILQEFTGYSENSRAVRMFVNNAWTTWSREHYGSGNGWSWEINPDGSVDLWCRQTVTDWNCTYTLGDSGWFRSHPLPRPELPFSVSDQVTSATYVPSDGHGGVLWSFGLEGPKYCTQFYLVRQTSVEKINGVIEYHVHGTPG